MLLPTIDGVYVPEWRIPENHIRNDDVSRVHKLNKIWSSKLKGSLSPHVPPDISLAINGPILTCENQPPETLKKRKERRTSIEYFLWYWNMLRFYDRWIKTKKPPIISNIFSISDESTFTNINDLNITCSWGISLAADLHLRLYKHNDKRFSNSLGLNDFRCHSR